jgi:hypothetical protein
MSIGFRGLETFGDSVSYEYMYKVNNEVAEVGSMSIIKIPFGDVIASMDNFQLMNAAIHWNIGELQIIRKASLVRDNIAPADYAAMKIFFYKIVKAESKYIVFR